MKHNDKDKNGKMSNWKATKKVKQPDGSYKISYERSSPSSSAPPKRSTEKMSNEAWKKYLASESPEKKKARLAKYAPPKKETKEEIIRPLKKMAKRSVELKPTTSKRKLTTRPTPPPPSTPPKKKSKPIYAKREKAPDRTWTKGTKGLKGLVKGAAGTLQGKKVVKDRAGYHVGTKVKQSTTRAVSAKRAGEKGVVEANLGSERQKQGQKRTASGLAKKKTMKGKRY